MILYLVSRLDRFSTLSLRLLVVMALATFIGGLFLGSLIYAQGPAGKMASHLRPDAVTNMAASATTSIESDTTNNQPPAAITALKVCQVPNPQTFWSLS